MNAAENAVSQLAVCGLSGKIAMALSLARGAGSMAFDPPDWRLDPGRYRAVLRIRSPQLPKVMSYLLRRVENVLSASPTRMMTLNWFALTVRPLR